MKADRNYFYELVDNVPEEKLSELRQAKLKLTIPEVEETEEEREATKRGKEQFEKGEFVSYKSLVEMEKDIMNDDTEA